MLVEDGSADKSIEGDPERNPFLVSSTDAGMERVLRPVPSESPAVDEDDEGEETSDVHEEPMTAKW
jgi:hypothetical protein